MSVNLPTLSNRVLSQAEVDRIRAICDDEQNKFGYGVFCAIIVRDALNSVESITKYVDMTRQFEEESKPLTVADAQALRQQVRDMKAELEALREFKATQVASLNGNTPEPTYRR